jgi:uncharacterized protein (TIGR02302 family)
MADRDTAAPATEAQDDRLTAARRQISRETRRSRIALGLERLVTALWPVWTVIALFLGLSLLGLSQQLGFWSHVALLTAFAAALAGTLWLGWRRWRTPSADEAVRRLDAEAIDRPVSALSDALAIGSANGATQALWQAHLRQMAERAKRMRAAPADLRVSGQDRYALRYAALLALSAGAIAQLGDGGTSLADALTPTAKDRGAVAGLAPSLEAWATPPVHTGVAPLYLTERVNEAAPISLPERTEITLRVFDTDEAPQLDGVPDTAFEASGEGSWTTTVVLNSPVSLSAAAEGTTLGGWHFDVIADLPPQIAFTSGPSAARSGALQFAFEASDDYGVVDARARVEIDAEVLRRDVSSDTVFEPAVFELPLPLTGNTASAAEEVVQDLTEHPWGGLPVVLTLTAEDGAGQITEVAHRMTLPQRAFYDPLAKAVIEERRDLAWSRENGPRVHRVLDAVTAYPEDVFDDVTAYMTLRSAIRRLDYALSDERLTEETPGIAHMVWLAAIRIEEGDLSSAEQRLRRLQEELSDAIENGASPDEIARLMEELRQAMNDYLRQMAEEAMRNQDQQAQQQQPVDPDQMMTQQDLNDMLSAIEEMLRSGMMEQARQMLQQLQQMLENLQMAQPGQQQQQGGQGNQAMEQLQDMIGEQQGLADRSFDALRQGQQQGNQQGQQGQPGQGQQGQGGQGQQFGQGGQGQQPGQGPGGQPGGEMPSLGDIARDQEALRQMLDDMRNGLQGGGGNEALDNAEESMGAARDALNEGDAEGALQNQVDALDQLRQGARDLAQQMQQGQPGQGQQAGRDGRSGNVRDEDPFGRPRASDGPLEGDSVRVPDASIMKRARELLDEIRRRAGERSRPELELDYLQRLLDRF